MRTRILLPFIVAPLLLAAQIADLDGRSKSRFRADHREAPSAMRDVDDPIWTEDFENGLNGWTVATIEGAVDWQTTTTGNTAGYTPGPLESTTGFPGGTWIVADSDAEGTAGYSENTTITSPAITGLGDHANMLLRFEQSFRQLNDDQTLVEVSGNGGGNWSTYPVNTLVDGNQSTPGAPQSEVVLINISTALQGGSNDIRIRFRWISVEGFTYSWQVDDIALLPVRTNDLAISEAVHAAWNELAPDYADLPCTIYLQGEERDLHFQARITNNGSAVQQNVRLRVEVLIPGGTSEDLYSEATALAPAATQMFTITDYALPGAIGTYTFVMTAVQDQEEEEPGDNSTNIQVRVDPYVFARDEGIMVTERDNNDEDYILGNRFLITASGRELQAVDVALGPGTDPGALITAAVYNGELDLVDESELYIVEPEDINELGGEHFISVAFAEPLALDADEVYLVAIHAYNGTEKVWIGLSGNSPPQTSLIYRTDENDWFYINNTPMVRMNFAQNVAVEETAVPGIALTASPSVFDEATRITIETPTNTSLAWSLRNAAGQELRSERAGSLPAGRSTLQLDTQDLADGIYLFTATTDLGSTTIRLVRQARR